LEKEKYFLGGFNLELKDIRKLALSNELSINYILKDIEISKIFKQLESKLEKVVLKGGTGINRVYFKKENRRFSEDIDFDIYSKEDINIVKEKLYIKLKEILKDYIVEKPRIMNETIRYDTYYKGIQKDKIKLEFKVINSNLNQKVITKKIVDYGFIPYTASIYEIYTLEELILQKLYAFVNRTDGKDSYDLYYLLQLDYNKTTLLNLIKAFNKEHNLELLEQTKTKLTELIGNQKQTRYLENSINHYIPRSKRQAFIGLLRGLEPFIFQI
jgi:uncharacterized protein